MAHASDIITRYHVYKDGRTGYQDWKGKPFKIECLEFGECVMYHPPGLKGRDKFENRWREGVWLGIADMTNEVIIGTDGGGNQGKRCEEAWIGKGSVEFG